MSPVSVANLHTFLLQVLIRHSPITIDSWLGFWGSRDPPKPLAHLCVNAHVHFPEGSYMVFPKLLCPAYKAFQPWPVSGLGLPTPFLAPCTCCFCNVYPGDPQSRRPLLPLQVLSGVLPLPLCPLPPDSGIYLPSQWGCSAVELPACGQQDQGSRLLPQHSANSRCSQGRPLTFTVRQPLGGPASSFCGRKQQPVREGLSLTKGPTAVRRGQTQHRNQCLLPWLILQFINCYFYL